MTSLALGLGIPVSSPALAASPWVGSVGFAWLGTRFEPSLERSWSGFGVEATGLRRWAPTSRSGVSLAFADHGGPGVGCAPEGESWLCRGTGFTSWSAAVVHEWHLPDPALRPFVGVGAGVLALAVGRDGPFAPSKTNHLPMVEVAIGLEGGTGLRPSIQWRWRQALGHLEVLDGASFDYHALSMGLVTNGGLR